MRRSLLTTMAGGISALVAGLLTGGGDRDIGATATGASSQANSYAIKATITTFTAGGANTGCRLPSNMEPGDEVYIYNNGTGAAILVYPSGTGNINGAGASTAVSLANNVMARVMCLTVGIYALTV